MGQLVRSLVWRQGMHMMQRDWTHRAKRNMGPSTPVLTCSTRGREAGLGEVSGDGSSTELGCVLAWLESGVQRRED